MQFPVGTKEAFSTLAGAPISGSAFGKAHAETARLSLLPAFSEILTGQSVEKEGAGAKEIEGLPEQAQKGAPQKRAEEDDPFLNLKMPLLAPHAQALSFAGSKEAHLQDSPRTSSVREKKDGASAGKTEKKSKTGTAIQSAGPGAVALPGLDGNQGNNVVPAAYVMPVSPVPPPAAHESGHEHSAAVLPQSKISSNLSPLHVQVSAAPERLAGTTVSVADAGSSLPDDKSSAPAEAKTQHDALASITQEIARNDAAAVGQSRDAAASAGNPGQAAPAFPHGRSNDGVHAAPVPAANISSPRAMAMNAVNEGAMTQQRAAAEKTTIEKTKISPKAVQEPPRNAASGMIPAGNAGQPAASGARGDVVLPAGSTAGGGFGGGTGNGASSFAAAGSVAQPAVNSNPFLQLDAGAPPAALLHASAHEVSVGVHDPSLGWVEIQTQTSAGHVSASLTAASTEAHANLVAEVPGLTQYLADRNVHVHAIGVSAQGGQAGGGQQHSGTGYPGAERYPQEKPSFTGMGHSLQESSEGESALYTGQSSYISVRA